jgi:hypothetical protein
VKGPTTRPHNGYTTGVEVAISLVVLIALVVAFDIGRTVKPKSPPRDATNTTTEKIIVDLDRRS